MKRPPNRKLALGLFLIPWAIAGLLYFFGRRPVVFNWEGTFPPSSISFEVHDAGLLLVPLSFVGFIWWIITLLFRRKDALRQ